MPPPPFTHAESDLAIHDEVLRFTRAELARYELADKFEPDAWRKMAEVGLMGLPFPREYGGAEAGISATVLAFEAFARGGGSLSLALSWGASVILCGIPILLFGTDEQKRRYLPGLASGGTIGAFALTEPGAGSDAAGLATRAVRTDHGYRLDGSKMFITNGPMADVVLVLASTDPAAGREGITAFLVDKGTPGFRTGKPLDKMGHRASPTCELIFDGCEIPASARLGPESRGFVEVAFSTLEWERSCMLGPMAGLGELVLERCAAHAKSRVQFGKPIAAFGAVRQHLGDIAIRATSAALLWRRMAWLKEGGHPAVLHASIAKLVMSEDGLVLADRAVQLHGGYGYIREYPVEQLYRDVKLYTLGGGTSEIQQRIILDILLRQRAKHGHACGLSLDDPFVAALAGPETVQRLRSFIRVLEQTPPRDAASRERPSREETRARIAALDGEGLRAGDALSNAMALELLAQRDPWLAGVAALASPDEDFGHPSGSATAEGRVEGRGSRVEGGEEGGAASARGWPTPEGLPYDVLALDVPQAGPNGTGQPSRLSEARRRVGLAAVACGAAAACLEQGLAIAAELRRDRAAPERQETLFPLARHFGELETARLLVWRAAQRLDAGAADAPALAAAAKVRATELAVRAVDTALGLTGRHGHPPAAGFVAAVWAVVAGLVQSGGAPAELRETLAVRALGE